MDLGLRGKVALVTGAGSGIGRAIALALGAEGARVVPTDLKGDTAEATAQEIVARGGEAWARTLDVTDFAQAQQVVREVVARFGRLDVLVNCAGAWRLNLFVDSTPEDWDFEVKVCFMGVVNCTRAVLDQMIAQQSGKIVNISSDAGRVGEVRQAVYSGAKAAVIGFSKAVAKEVGRYNIHVNCVCPGYTKTPATERYLTPELEARIVKAYPLRKLGLPEDVAKAVVFLASEGASHITGQTLSVSGGYSMV
ncbi:MAG: 3-oxoacyl-ACP reductase [Candidatus Tectimicrobiota bacterium]|nr:MAG: 3-oxoacyl-ACP reductase [Candidatus Tectomicrobia bacterium]